MILTVLLAVAFAANTTSFLQAKSESRSPYSDCMTMFGSRGRADVCEGLSTTFLETYSGLSTSEGSTPYSDCMILFGSRGRADVCKDLTGAP